MFVAMFGLMADSIHAFMDVVFSDSKKMIKEIYQVSVSMDFFMIVIK